MMKKQFGHIQKISFVILSMISGITFRYLVKFKIILTILLICNIHSSAYPCRCDPSGGPPINEASESADLIFVGSCISTAQEIKTFSHEGETETFGLNSCTFKVTKVLKGQMGEETTVVHTGFGGGDCGFPFKTDSTYLIYGSSFKYMNEEYIFTGICSRTKLVTGSKQANDEIIELSEIFNKNNQ